MDQQTRYDNLKLGERAAWISIAAYLCLSALKLLVGYTAHSEALKADGLNNATDIVASIAVLVGLRIAQKPADHDHPYGHWRSETIASLVASFIMLAVGLQVLVEAAVTLFRGRDAAPELLSVWVGGGCAVLMLFVYRYNQKLARRINSQAVMAAAKDNLSDAFVSIGTVIGILGSQLGLPWLDPLAAIVVGYLICRTGWEIFREASHHLSDGFSESEMAAYKQQVLKVKGVKRVKEIRARSYGSNTVVDVILLLDASMAFQAAHAIATQVEDQLKSVGVYEVHVHYEPLV